MGNKISKWQFWGFVFTSALGTALHFLYDLTGGSPIAALISATNESVWEHLKLIFFPMVIYAIIEYKYWGREVESFWNIKSRGIASALILIPVIYYTILGVFGSSPDIVNILIFYIVAAISYIYENRLFNNASRFLLPKWAVIAILCAMALMFFVFSFLPPDLAIFKEP